MTDNETTAAPAQDTEADSSDQAHNLVPRGEKIAYGVGAATNQVGEQGYNAIAIPVYNIFFGVNPALVSMVMGLMRLWDALADPIMGNISDNWKGAKGRRKPFIFIGSILLLFAYPALWSASPGWTENVKVIYFTCTSIIFFTCYTIFSVCWRSLGTELTPDYQERVSVQVYTALCVKLYALFVPYIFFLAQLDWFGDPVLGIRVVTGVSALFLMIAGIVSSIVPRERYRQVAAKEEKVKLVSSFKSLLGNKTFLLLHGVGLGLLCSMLLIMAVGQYVNMYYVWQGDIKQGALVNGYSSTVLTALGFVMLYVINRFLIHMEKKRLIFYALLIALVGSASKWWLFTPEHPWWVLAVPIFFAPAYTIFWAVWLSMLADYCDYDEYLHKQRREGVFNAVSGWIMKAGGAAATAAAGVILNVTGFDMDLGGEQSDSTFLMMRIFFVALPLVCLLLGIAFNHYYKLDKETMNDIRKTLEERRGAVS